MLLSRPGSLVLAPLTPKKSRSKYDLNAIWESLKVECPYCHFILEPSQYLTRRQRRLRCKFATGHSNENNQDRRSGRAEKGELWSAVVRAEREQRDFFKRISGVYSRGLLPP